MKASTQLLISGQRYLHVAQISLVYSIFFNEALLLIGRWQWIALDAGEDRGGIENELDDRLGV